jgi:hypothetical protein
MKDLLDRLEEGHGQKDAMKGLKYQIDKLIDKQPVYVVVDLVVDFKSDAPSFKHRVSGNLLRVSAWLEDVAKMPDIRNFIPKVVGFSTDRNWARGQADEV